MRLLTQTRFPRLWLLMQNMIGGNASKKELAIENYRGEKHVLEIGCSVGNISSVFSVYPNIYFTGIDIDKAAIDLARKRFRKFQNFQFSLRSLEELSTTNEKFDYVLFAGILHHVDDSTCLALLKSALDCTSVKGRVVIYEPEIPKDNDNWLLHFFCKRFEQGKYLRSRDELQRLIVAAGILLESVQDRMISPGIIKRPYVARFNLFVGRRST